tara:strand:- start:1075 stop:1788 length:714 start_codon:yes stop_codon:yes gene_type:complete
MANKIDNKAFQSMIASSEADVTAANLFPQEDSGNKSSEAIHNALMVAGFTPLMGNVADAADALLYSLEGEFGQAALSAASIIPFAGQLVAAKRTAKIVKRGAKEYGPFLSEADVGDIVTKDLTISGKPAGYIQGKVTDMGISVQLISVKKQYQRLGFGTDLYKSLQKETTGLVYSYGWQQNVDTANKVWESLVKGGKAGKTRNWLNTLPDKMDVYYLKKPGVDVKFPLKGMSSKIPK